MRFHQTLKKHLIGRPRAATLADLQNQIDAFTQIYNHARPHRSLPHQATPATAYTARPKATPGKRLDTHNRVRRDRVDDTGSITLRAAGRLHHIGVGRTHARTHVLMLIQDLHIRIINAATGELIRELTLDPTGITNPAASPAAAQRKSCEPKCRFTAMRMS